MSYSQISLADCCDSITKGTTPTSLGLEFSDRGVPFVRVNNFKESRLVFDDSMLSVSEDTNRSLSRSIIRPNDVLLSIAGTVGRSCVVPEDSPMANCNQAVCVIRPKKVLLLPNYLQYWLGCEAANDQMSSGKVTGVISNISLTVVRHLKIPLPPLPEQKRIAKILDAADTLRAKRRESIAQLDALVQSTFLEMFGDPKINPMSWPVEPLSHVVAQLTGGKNVSASETPTSFRILKVSAVTSGIFRPSESKYLPADFSFPDSYIVKASDLLISRANTTELVGATAYVWETPENIVLPDKIWRIEIKDDAKIEPLFLFVLSRGKHFRSMLSERASGTSGSMRNISKPKLLSTPIILPPIVLQKRFASIVQAIQTQKSLLQTHLSELNTLFASLQSRAFNGEL